MYMKRQPVGSMLEDWYGRERAQAEKLRYLPATRSISEIITTVARRALPSDAIAMAQLKADWPDVAGPEIAAKTMPSHMDGSRLFVEISHPAWLSHFRSPQVKKALLERIRKSLGETACLDIVFIPAGRRVPDKEDA